MRERRLRGTPLSLNPRSSCAVAHNELSFLPLAPQLSATWPTRFRSCATPCNPMSRARKNLPPCRTALDSMNKALKESDLGKIHFGQAQSAAAMVVAASAEPSWREDAGAPKKAATTKATNLSLLQRRERFLHPGQRRESLPPARYLGQPGDRILRHLRERHPGTDRKIGERQVVAR